MPQIRDERDVLRRLQATSRAQAKRKLVQSTEAGILISFYDSGIALYHKGRRVDLGYPIRPGEFWKVIVGFEREAQTSSPGN